MRKQDKNIWHNSWAVESYSIKVNSQDLKSRFDVRRVDGILDNSEKVRPFESAPVVFKQGGIQQTATFKWGMIPFSKASGSVTRRTLEIPAESLIEKRFNISFRVFQQRRCVCLIDKFTVRMFPNSDELVTVTSNPGEPFAVAGVWDCWSNAMSVYTREPENFRTFAMLTVPFPPEAGMEFTHLRMPFVLSRDAATEWLNSRLDPYGLVREIFNQRADDAPEMTIKVSQSPGSELN